MLFKGIKTNTQSFFIVAGDFNQPTLMSVWLKFRMNFVTRKNKTLDFKLHKRTWSLQTSILDNHIIYPSF